MSGLTTSRIGHPGVPLDEFLLSPVWTPAAGRVPQSRLLSCIARPQLRATRDLTSRYHSSLHPCAAICGERKQVTEIVRHSTRVYEEARALPKETWPARGSECRVSGDKLGAVQEIYRLSRVVPQKKRSTRNAWPTWLSRKQNVVRNVQVSVSQNLTLLKSELTAGDYLP